MMNLKVQCLDCKRLEQTPGPWHCKAFPEGIPEEIYGGSHDHTKPFRGDNGILFEPKEKQS